MFEQGRVITADKSIVQNAKSERQKEIEMLLSRWNKNKGISEDISTNNPTEEENILPEPKKQVNE